MCSHYMEINATTFFFKPKNNFGEVRDAGGASDQDNSGTVVITVFSSTNVEQYWFLA